MRSAGPTAQRSKASLSGSLPFGAIRLFGQMLLNARKRRCRVHIRPMSPSLGLSSAQRSKASLSGSHHDDQAADRPDHLLNARKRRCRVHRGIPPGGPRTRSLLNARKRRCRVHVIVDPIADRETTAQRSKASLSGSHKPGSSSDNHDDLLNARKRRCRVHDRRADLERPSQGCSTLESVVVGFTWTDRATPRRSPAAQRSKASLSGSRANSASGMSMNRTAQRSKASLSGSRFASACPRRTWASAQRSKASLSGSPVGFLEGFVEQDLLNARKRRCRVHIAQCRAH